MSKRLSGNYKGKIQIIFATVLVCLLLSGCKPERDHQKNFNWAVDFCGGKGKIASFSTTESTLLSDWAYCEDGRRVDIPDQP